jgi:hypothetical protein
VIEWQVAQSRVDEEPQVRAVVRKTFVQHQRHRLVQIVLSRGSVVDGVLVPSVDGFDDVGLDTEVAMRRRMGHARTGGELPDCHALEAVRRERLSADPRSASIVG